MKTPHQRKTRLGIILSSLLLVHGGSAGARNLLNNGGFESPVLSNPAISNSPPLPGWGGVPRLFSGDNGSPWPAGAAGGQQFADAGNSPATVISQSFVVSDDEWLGAVRWRATAPEDLSAGTCQLLLRDKASGTLLETKIFTVHGGPAATGVWDSYTLSLDSGPYSAGVYQLEFSAVNTSSKSFFIDEVEAIATPFPLPNISASAKFAWAANAGWINFRPSEDLGTVVSEGFLANYAYSANLGWIDLGDGTPKAGHQYSNTDNSDHGVNLASGGDLSGLAWSANAGWINFGWATDSDPNRPRIDLLTGEFLGYAYGANIGWIQLGGGGLIAESLHCPDLDGDQLGDAWELAHLGNLGISNGIGDFDGDGVSDKDEFIAFTNPTDHESRPQVTDSGSNDANTKVSLTFTSKIGRLYRIQYSNNLSTWNDSGLGPFLPDSDTTTQRTFYPPGGDDQYYRVAIFKPLQ